MDEEQDGSPAVEGDYEDPQMVADCPTRLRQRDLDEIVDSCPGLSKYRVVLPGKSDRACSPPPGYVACYQHSLTYGSFRLPPTPYFMEVLEHYGLGLAQLHPLSVFKLVAAELVQVALGQKPSLDFFRLMFSVVTKDNSKKVFSKMPSSLKGWRFYYFFVEASFIPRGSPLLGWISSFDPKLNRPPRCLSREVSGLVNRVKSLTIPFKEYLKGILVKGGVCRVYARGRLPVIFRKSTRRPMSLLDCLLVDDSVELAVKGYPVNEALDLYVEAGEDVKIADSDDAARDDTIVGVRGSPSPPGGIGDRGGLEGGGGLDDDLGPLHVSPLSTDPDVLLDLSIGVGQELGLDGASTSLARRKRRSEGDVERGGDKTPRTSRAEDGVEVEGDKAPRPDGMGGGVEIGGDKSLRTAGPSSSRFGVGKSLSSLAGFGIFATPPGFSASTTAFATSSVATAGGVTFGTTSAGTSGAVCGTTSCGSMFDMAAIPHGLLGGLPRVVEPFRFGGSGGDLDPEAAARYLASTEGKSRDELFAMARVSVFNSFVDFAIASDRDVKYQQEREQALIDMRSQLAEREGEVSGLRAEVGREREVSRLAQDESRVFREKYEHVTHLVAKEREEKDGLVGSVRSLGEEIERMESSHGEELRVLRSQLSEKDVEIARLRAELASSQAKVGDLEGSVLAAVQRRRDLLGAFPRIFREVILHPDVMGVLARFNKATISYGKHLASATFLSSHPRVTVGSLPFYDLGTLDALKEANLVFQEKAFPILDLLVADLDLTVDEILSLVSPQT